MLILLDEIHHYHQHRLLLFLPNHFFRSSTLCYFFISLVPICPYFFSLLSPYLVSFLLCRIHILPFFVSPFVIFVACSPFSFFFVSSSSFFVFSSSSSPFRLIRATHPALPLFATVLPLARQIWPHRILHVVGHKPRASLAVGWCTASLPCRDHKCMITHSTLLCAFPDLSFSRSSFATFSDR